MSESHSADSHSTDSRQDSEIRKSLSNGVKLLVVTQTVDTDDPKLGFFHHWLEEFATKFEHIQVICLEAGKYALPPNVTVHSLGRENGGNRVLYALRFLRKAWGLSKEYDAVFVHMNPEYIALAGDFWLMKKKPVGLWYNHEVGSIWLKFAQPFVKTIFHTSPFAYPARYKNACIMPAGIDTDIFTPQNVERAPNSIYFQGRVSPAKRVHVLLEAVRTLRREGIDARVTIVGPEDAEYGKALRNDFKDVMDAVEFLGPKKNEDTPALYGAHEVSVNLTADGNFDKTALEPLACETPVIVSSKAFAGIVAPEWVVPADDAPALAASLGRMFALTPGERHSIGAAGRKAVIEKHSLASLADKLAQSYERHDHTS